MVANADYGVQTLVETIGRQASCLLVLHGLFELLVVLFRRVDHVVGGLLKLLAVVADEVGRLENLGSVFQRLFLGGRLFDFWAATGKEAGQAEDQEDSRE